MKQLTFLAMAAKRFTVVECVRAHVKFFNWIFSVYSIDAIFLHTFAKFMDVF